MTRFRKSRSFAFLVGFILAAAAGALAAWIIFSGVHGSTQGKVGSPTTQDAITLNSVAPTGTLVPGSPETVAADLVNNAGVTESITALSASSITASNGCNTSAITFSPLLNQLQNIPPGGEPGTGVGTLTAASNLDPNCAGATLTVTLAGTTSP